MNDSINQIFELARTGNLKEAASLINQKIEQKENLENMNIALAHILLLAGDWSYMNRLLPKDTNFFMTSGYLNSIGMGRPINGHDQPVPWFTYPAIDFLDGIVKPEWNVFEWGSGNSTLWWASRVESVTAVEDNAAWFEEVTQQMPGNATVLKREGEDYYSAISEFGGKLFDAVIVDGSSRNDCARFAVSHLKESGILIFDNSDDGRYEESSDFLNEMGFLRIDFWGLIPSYLYKNCTSIYLKDPKILGDNTHPSNHQSSVGISCFQAMANNKTSKP